MLRDPELTENFSFRGTWWLPEFPEERASGMLFFDSNEGVTLSLEQPLEPHSFTDPKKRKALNRPPLDPERNVGPPLVLGQHDDGRMCTVFGAAVKSRQTGGAGVVRVEYTGSALLLGAAVDCADEAFVKAIEFRCTNLEEWLGENPFAGHSDGRGEDFLYTINYRYPRSFATQIPSHDFTISTHSSLSTSVSISKVELAHRSLLRMQFDSARQIEDVLNFAIEVRRILTLMIDFPVYFLDVRVEGDEAPDQDAFNLYIAQPYHRTKEIFQSQMLLPFARIRDRFGAILSTWLDRAERLRAVYQLIESIFYGPPMSVEIALLTLTQAFEIFHRDQIGGTYTDTDTYGQIRESLVGAIPRDVDASLREALTTRLRYGTSYSMRKRIEVALKTFGDVANVLTRNSSRFSKRIADTRNYLTHRDESSKGDVISHVELFTATRKFRYFLLVLMMNVLGVPTDETIRALKADHHRANTLNSDII